MPTYCSLLSLLTDTFRHFVFLSCIPCYSLTLAASPPAASLCCAVSLIPPPERFQFSAPPNCNHRLAAVGVGWCGESPCRPQAPHVRRQAQAHSTTFTPWPAAWHSRILRARSVTLSWDTREPLKTEGGDKTGLKPGL